MQIRNGRFKGTKVLFKPHPSLRPTPEKVKSALLEVLKIPLQDAVVLDVFCGTGILGLEAWSQGAKKVVFIDDHKFRCFQLKKQIRRWGWGAHLEVFCCDAEKAAKKLHDRLHKFDLIFADPPYNTTLATQWLLTVLDQHLLKPQGWLVIETFKKTPLPERAATLECVRKTTYGDTTLHYYTVASA